MAHQFSKTEFAAMADEERRPPESMDIRLSPEDVKELSKYLGRNISSALDLVSAARNVSMLRIKGMESAPIVLDPHILNRLKSRCHPTTDFPQFVREVVIKQLADYAGA